MKYFSRANFFGFGGHYFFYREFAHQTGEFMSVLAKTQNKGGMSCYSSPQTSFQKKYYPQTPLKTGKRQK